MNKTIGNPKNIKGEAYVLREINSNKLYAGQTTQGVKKRLSQHNSKSVHKMSDKELATYLCNERQYHFEVLSTEPTSGIEELDNKEKELIQSNECCTEKGLNTQKGRTRNIKVAGNNVTKLLGNHLKLYNYGGTHFYNASDIIKWGYSVLECSNENFDECDIYASIVNVITNEQYKSPFTDKESRKFDSNKPRYYIDQLGIGEAGYFEYSKESVKNFLIEHPDKASNVIIKTKRRFFNNVKDTTELSELNKAYKQLLKTKEKEHLFFRARKNANVALAYVIKENELIKKIKELEEHIKNVSLKPIG